MVMVTSCLDFFQKDKSAGTAPHARQKLFYASTFSRIQVKVAIHRIKIKSCTFINCPCGFPQRRAFLLRVASTQTHARTRTRTHIPPPALAARTLARRSLPLHCKKITILACEGRDAQACIPNVSFVTSGIVLFLPSNFLD
jgi:hypothetical protein